MTSAWKWNQCTLEMSFLRQIIEISKEKSHTIDGDAESVDGVVG